jgi:superfamily II DNA or RNA helicase
MNLTHVTNNTNSLNQLPLRDYQQESVAQIFSHWSRDKNILVQQPTGAGKSLIIAAVIEEFIKLNRPVLLIAHKVELIRQLQAHCQKWFPQIEVGIIANQQQFKRNENALIQIASIQAFNRLKTHQYPDASLVVFDEAHHCHARSYAQLFSHYENSSILGVTATPMRLDGKGLKTLYGGVNGFDHLITGVAVRELIERGYLSDFKFYTPVKLLDPKAAGIHTRMGDYVQSELEEYTRKTLIYGDVIKTWERHAKGLRTVVYPVSVKYSQELCKAFQKAGYPAEHLDADTPAKKREAILNRFQRGKTLILCQHSIIIEGVDVPDIGAVVFARPTKSLTIWFQAIGRSLRPATNKQSAIIIDHTTTHLSLPFPDQEIEWSLEPITIPKPTNHGVTCPKCRHFYHLNSEELSLNKTTCSSCETKYLIQTKYQHNQPYYELREIVKREGQRTIKQVVEVIPAQIEYFDAHPLNADVVSFLKAQLHHAKLANYSPSWVYYRYKEAVLKGYLPLGLFELKALAQKLNYQQGWAYHKYKEIHRELTLTKF